MRWISAACGLVAALALAAVLAILAIGVLTNLLASYDGAGFVALPEALAAFPNFDGIFHNVFSVSGDNRFDLDLYKRPKSGSWTFQHAGIARVYCNIHPQMSAVVVVRDSPFFTKAARLSISRSIRSTNPLRIEWGATRRRS